MRTIENHIVLSVLLTSAALASLSACSDAGGDATSTTHTALSSGLIVKTSLTVSSAVASAGHTVQASVTYENDSGAPLTVSSAAIAARPPGGSHAGGPYADFMPYASARTLAAGETITVSASRAFTADDAKGSWSLYPTWQDESGGWHDGPDTTLAVGELAPCATPPTDPPANGAGTPSSGAPLIDAPIAGATSGSWQSGVIDGMSYQLLLPAGYSSAHAYPLVLYLHQLDNASQIPAQIDPWFNDPDFRSKHPAIVVAPQCNQDADPSGQTINWGGVSGDPQPCQEHAIALVDRLMSTYSVYAPKVYVTGNSMGGIGSWDLIFKYNTKNPTVRPLFAATLILAGAAYSWGYPDPDPSLVARVKDVPIWSIHGGSDGQVPLAWDQNMYAAEQKVGGAMRLLIDPALGHDVWDTYYVTPRAETYWSWLFAQSE